MTFSVNKHGKTPDFNKDEYLKKFIPLVIKHAPEFDSFSVFELSDKLNLSKDEQKIFEIISFDIRKHLVENEIAKMDGSRKITLKEKGRDIKNGTEKIFGTIINNDFSNSTIGQVSQAESLTVDRTEIKQEISPPSPNPTNKKPIFSKLIEYWWTFIIALIAGIILILIERGIIDIGI